MRQINRKPLRHVFLIGAGLFLLFSFMNRTAGAKGDIVVGELYDPESLDRVLYRIKKTEHGFEDTTIVRTEYRELNGDLVAWDEVSYQNGELIRFELGHPKAGEFGSLNVDGDLLHFSFSQDGAEKRSVRKYRYPLLVTDNIYPFIQKNFQKLDDGEKVKAYAAVLDRRDVYAFQFQKINDIDFNGKPASVVEMRISNKLLQIFVKPLRFTVDRNLPHNLLLYEGRVTPKKKKGSRWVSFDTQVVYKVLNKQFSRVE
jgi:hypothetical protein